MADGLFRIAKDYILFSLDIENYARVYIENDARVYI